MKDKVSIIIPIFNSEKHLNKCLESVINQTYNNIEIICVDDGSKDNSLELLKKYSQKDKRIKIISKKNEGQLITRLKGLEKATGEYILFVDSDDWIDIDSIEKMISINKKYNADIIKFTYIDEHVEENRSMQSSPAYNEITFIEKKDFSKMVYSIFLKTQKLNSMCCQLIRKKNIKKFEYDDSIRIGEDLSFNFELYTNANNVLFVPDAYYHYRANNQSISNSNTVSKVKNRIENTIEVYYKLYSYTEKWKINNKNNEDIICNKILDEIFKGFNMLYMFKNSIKDKKNILSFSHEKLAKKIDVNIIKANNVSRRLFIKKRYKTLILYNYFSFKPLYEIKKVIKKFLVWKNR